MSRWMNAGLGIVIGVAAGLVVLQFQAAPEMTGSQVVQAAEEEKPAAKETEKKDDKKPEFKTTKSGLKYRVLKEGKGKMPKASDTVKCHYKGWLDNGKEFDSSYKRKEPTEFPLNGVIAGWTEGLQLVGEGGEIELEIPYQIAYGERGRPPTIPPKATLHFTIELLQVK